MLDIFRRGEILREGRTHVDEKELLRNNTPATIGSATA
jgi:hypothetical protein